MSILTSGTLSDAERLGIRQAAGLSRLCGWPADSEHGVQLGLSLAFCRTCLGDEIADAVILDLMDYHSARDAFEAMQWLPEREYRRQQAKRN